MIGKSYSYKDGKVWKTDGSNRLEVPKPEDREQIIRNAHINSNNMQVSKTLGRLKDEFFWHKMAADTKKSIDRCDICQKYRHHKTEYPKARVFKSTADSALRELSVDLFGGLPPTEPDGYERVLVI